MERKKFFRIAVVILLIVCMVVVLMQNAKYGNIYNRSDEEILTDYPEVQHTMLYSSSILDNRELEASMLLMNGNGSICNLTSTQQATMELSVDRKRGKGRLLLKNQESGEICSVPLENGDTEIGVDAGSYQVFLTGKWFGGNLTLKSDEVLFHAE